MSTTIPPTVFTKLGFDPGYLPVFEDKLFIEGTQTARRLTNFFVCFYWPQSSPPTAYSPVRPQLSSGP